MSRHALAFAVAIVIAACSSRDPGSGDTAQAGLHMDDSTGTKAEHHDEATERITLSEAAYRAAEIQVEPVQLDSSLAGEDLEVPGQVEFDPRRVALVSARIPGRIERLMVVEGDRVDSGAVLAELYSPAYLTAQDDFVQAQRRAGLLTGTTDEVGARAIADAARRRLAMLGAGADVISRLEATGVAEEHLALRAPFAGSLMATHALTGQMVEAGQEIFKLADPSVVDVVADVPERSLPLVRVGQAATIAIAAYPGMQFAGTVERLRGELNPETRTVSAVIHAGNAARRLRPGMFATVRLAVPAAPGSPAVLTIPESAVVTDGERRFVFVEVGVREFERRAVEVSSLAPPGSTAPLAERVAVRRGLTPGDRVAVAGAFTLKSELAKATLGEHGH